MRFHKKAIKHATLIHTLSKNHVNSNRNKYVWISVGATMLSIVAFTYNVHEVAVPSGLFGTVIVGLLEEVV